MSTMPAWLRRKLSGNPPKGRKRRAKARTRSSTRARSSTRSSAAGPVIRASKLGQALQLNYVHVDSGKGHKHHFRRGTAVAHFRAGTKDFLIIGPVQVREFIDD